MLIESGAHQGALAAIDNVWNQVDSELANVFADSPEIPTGIPRLVFEHTGAIAMSFPLLVRALIQHVPERREFWDGEEEIEFDDAEELAEHLIRLDIDGGEIVLDSESHLLRLA